MMYGTIAFSVYKYVGNPLDLSLVILNMIYVGILKRFRYIELPSSKCD